MPTWLKTAIIGSTVLPLVENGWRYAGGGAFFFHAIKTFIFGKTIRIREYPDGEMITVLLRRNNLKSLRNAIAESQPPIHPKYQLKPEDIRVMCSWTSPQFTEKIEKPRDLRFVHDGGWILWSRIEDDIPAMGVTLDFDATRGAKSKTDSFIQYVKYLRKTSLISLEEEESLLDMILNQDMSLLVLYRNFKHVPELFLHYVRRRISKNLPKSQSALIDTT